MGCTTIFSGRAGNVIAIPVDIDALFHFSVDGIEEFYTDFKAIITSLGIQGQGGYQFIHTMSDFIYLYVFNERVGEIVLSGIAFANTCNHADDTRTGISRLLKFYNKNRVTSRRTAIIITIDDLAYTCFLTNVKIDITDPATGLAQFALRFNYVPVIDPADPCAKTGMAGKNSTRSADNNPPEEQVEPDSSPEDEPSGSGGDGGDGETTPVDGSDAGRPRRSVDPMVPPGVHVEYQGSPYKVSS